MADDLLQISLPTSHDIKVHDTLGTIAASPYDFANGTDMLSMTRPIMSSVSDSFSIYLLASSNFLHFATLWAREGGTRAFLPVSFPKDCEYRVCVLGDPAFKDLEPSFGDPRLHPAEVGIALNDYENRLPYTMLPFEPWYSESLIRPCMVLDRFIDAILDGNGSVDGQVQL